MSVRVRQEPAGERRGVPKPRGSLPYVFAPVMAPTSALTATPPRSPFPLSSVVCARALRRLRRGGGCGGQAQNRRLAQLHHCAFLCWRGENACPPPRVCARLRVCAHVSEGEDLACMCTDSSHALVWPLPLSLFCLACPSTQVKLTHTRTHTSRAQKSKLEDDLYEVSAGAEMGNERGGG